MYDRLIGNVCYHKFYMIVECVIEHISGKYYNVWFIWKGKKQNGEIHFKNLFGNRINNASSLIGKSYTRYVIGFDSYKHK